MDQDKHIQLQEYLDNLMSEEDSTAFEKELNNDEQLQTDFELLKDIEHELGNKELIDFKKKLSGVMEQPIQATVIKKDKGKVISLSRRILSLAASFLVIGIASWWMFTGNIDVDGEQYLALADEHFIHYPAQEISRGSEKENSIYKNYEAKNYTIAAPELEKYALENSDNDALLIAAISYLASDNSAKSIILLQEIPELPYLINKKNYYLALAHLEQGHKTTAIIALQTITKADQYFYNKAQNLLTELQ